MERCCHISLKWKTYVDESLYSLSTIAIGHLVELYFWNVYNVNIVYNCNKLNFHWVIITITNLGQNFPKLLSRKCQHINMSILSRLASCGLPLLLGLILIDWGLINWVNPVRSKKVICPIFNSWCPMTFPRTSWQRWVIDFPKWTSTVRQCVPSLLREEDSNLLYLVCCYYNWFLLP